jgi:hypothetical protein
MCCLDRTLDRVQAALCPAETLIAGDLIGDVAAALWMIAQAAYSAIAAGFYFA